VKVPYDEGVAYHIGPESCAGARKDVGEALTGGMQAGYRAAKNFFPRVLTLSELAEGNMDYLANARGGLTLRGLRPRACMQVSCTGIGRA